MSLKDSDGNANGGSNQVQLSAAQLVMEDLLFQLKSRHARTGAQMAFDFSEFGCALPNAQPIHAVSKVDPNSAGSQDDGRPSAGAAPDPFPWTQVDDEILVFDCFVSRTRNLAKYSLCINGNTFKDDFEFSWLKPESTKWSYFLTAMSRAKVSRALRVVRTELQVMGLRPGCAPVSPVVSAME